MRKDKVLRVGVIGILSGVVCYLKVSGGSGYILGSLLILSSVMLLGGIYRG